MREDSPMNSRSGEGRPPPARISADGVQVKHIPAHTSAAAVREGKLTAREQYGNRLADQRAKEGAALQAPNYDDILILEGCLARARDAARYSAECEVYLTDEGRRDCWPTAALDDIDLTQFLDDDGRAFFLDPGRGAASAAGTPGFSAAASLAAAAAGAAA